MNNLKAVSSNDNEFRVANYIVLFGGRDLTGEFFTKNTNIESPYTQTGVLHVDFEHGYDAEKAGNSPHNVLGRVDWSTAKADDTGIFVERVLNRRAKYVQHLENLISAGIMGTSSEAILPSITKKASGEIIDWPLMRDSLTVTPMEPRMINENIITSVKSLIEFFPNSKSLYSVAGLEAPEEIKDIKSIDMIPDLRSAEKYLRDSGMTRTEAVAFIGRVKSLSQSDSVEDDLQLLTDALARRNFKSN